MSTKEKYLIVDRVRTIYVGGLDYWFKPHVFIHIHRWCVMDCTVQRYVEVDILGVLLGLVHNDGWHKEYPIVLGKKLSCIRMVLALQFALSIFVHPKITFKYRWTFPTFHWYQTQFHHSSINDWILVEYNWGHKGW